MPKYTPNSVMPLALAFVAGWLGSLVPRLLAPMQAQAAASPVLRANRFELVDDSAKLRAVIECGRAGQPHFRMLSVEGGTTVDIGIAGSASPYLTFNGSDGSPRVAVKMGFGDKPVLMMGDRASPSKLILGSVNSDLPDPSLDTWALAFVQPPPHHRDLAGINANFGSGKIPIAGSVFVVDARERLVTLGDREAR